jgi:hypothetical protein
MTLSFANTGSAISDTLNGSYYTQSYSIQSLQNDGGVNIGYANSMVIYVTVGSTFALTGSSFVAPSFTASSNNPNYNTFWNTAEITYQSGTVGGDQSDVTEINQWSVPLALSTYSSTIQSAGTLVQSNAAYLGSTQPLAQLEALANANTANNNVGGTPSNFTVTNSGAFVRQISPASGGFSGTNTAAFNTIGPYPAYGNNYANYIANNSISTSITGTINGGTNAYQFTVTSTTAPSWVANATTATGTGNGILVTGSFLVNGTSSGTYGIFIAGDQYVTTNTANYTLSAALYQSAYVGNNGVSYMMNGTNVATDSSGNPVAWYTSIGGTSSETNGQQVANQMMHDVFGGLTYGLVGNNTVLSSSLLSAAGYTGSGTTWNEIGSQGWTDLENLIKTGTYSGTLPDLFGLTSGTNDLYNEWAGIIYANNPNVYGMQYSDFLQYPVVQSATYNSTSIQSMNLDVMSVPEPSASALFGVAAVLAAAGYALHRRTRQPAGRTSDS